MAPNIMPLDSLLGQGLNSDQETVQEIRGHSLQALIDAEAGAAEGPRLRIDAAHRGRVGDPFDR